MIVEVMTQEVKEKATVQFNSDQEIVPLRDREYCSKHSGHINKIAAGTRIFFLSFRLRQMTRPEEVSTSDSAFDLYSFIDQLQHSGN